MWPRWSSSLGTNVLPQFSNLWNNSPCFLSKALVGKVGHYQPDGLTIFHAPDILLLYRHSVELLPLVVIFTECCSPFWSLTHLLYSSHSHAVRAHWTLFPNSFGNLSHEEKGICCKFGDLVILRMPLLAQSVDYAVLQWHQAPVLSCLDCYLRGTEVMVMKHIQMSFSSYIWVLHVLQDCTLVYTTGGWAVWTVKYLSKDTTKSLEVV